jgi:hypothetical protein
MMSVYSPTIKFSSARDLVGTCLDTNTTHSALVHPLKIHIWTRSHNQCQDLTNFYSSLGWGDHSDIDTTYRSNPVVFYYIWWWPERDLPLVKQITVRAPSCYVYYVLHAQATGWSVWLFFWNRSWANSVHYWTTESQIEYVHTKDYQIQNKKKHGWFQSSKMAKISHLPLTKFRVSYSSGCTLPELIAARYKCFRAQLIIWRSAAKGIITLAIAKFSFTKRFG